MRRFCCALLLLICPLAGARDAPLRFVFAYEDRELPPFYMGSGETVPAAPGVYIELIQKLAAAHPALKLELRRMPWKRCLANLRDGEVDALIASYQPERREFGAYPFAASAPLATAQDANSAPPASLRLSEQTYALYRRRNTALRWDGQQLHVAEGVTGAPRGYSIVADLRKNGIKVDEIDNTEIALRMLRTGRLAGVATLDVVAAPMLLRDEFSAVEKLSPPLVTKAYYLMLSHRFVDQHPDLAQSLWQTVVRLREQDAPALYQRYAQ